MDTLQLIEVLTGKVVRIISGEEGVFSPDGKFILSRAKKQLALHDRKTGATLWRRPFPLGEIYPVAASFSLDGRNVIVSNEERTVNEWAFPNPTYQLTASMQVLDSMTGQLVKEFGKFSLPSKYILGAIKDWGRTVVPSPNGVHAVTGDMGGKYKIWDIVQGRIFRTIETSSEVGSSFGSSALLPAIAYSPKGNVVVLAGLSGARVFDVQTGEERAMMIAFEDGEWLVMTPNGYYNSSEKGAQYLAVIVEGKKYSVDQFYDVFYRPDIVSAKLRGDDISGLVTISMKDAIKSPPPDVQFTSEPVKSDQSQVKICYKVQNSGGGIGEVRLFQNSKLIRSDGYYRDMAKVSSEKAQIMAMNSKSIYENMRSVAIKGKAESASIINKLKGDVYEDCSLLDAVPGENEVSIAAFNSANTVQTALKTVKFTSTRAPEASHLYILAIGLDQYRDKNVNLKYAVKDAKDIEEKLRQQSESLYDPRNIHYTLLTNKEATKSAILNKINELSRTIKATDSFVLFVAGHGVLLQSQYYMLTHDYSGQASDASMISSNEIVEMSKKIRSLSQLFIFDTCHAGGMDAIVSGLYDARMSVLAKKMGLHIYASANSVQEAMDGYQGNGLFSHTLLKGLKNNKQADKNNDGKVSLVELGDYAKTLTTDISNGLGHAQTPFIINFGKDSPIYTIK